MEDGVSTALMNAFSGSEHRRMFQNIKKERACMKKYGKGLAAIVSAVLRVPLSTCASKELAAKRPRSLCVRKRRSRGRKLTAVT